MEIIVYAIPFITCILLLSFWRKETVWWEYLIVILPSILLAILVEGCMKGYNTSDTEYLGSYVTSIRHYDRWNEYIHRTCTREVPCGRDSKGRTIYRTETYDCSYVENHPERWTYTTNTNSREEYFYNENEFLKVKNKLQAEEVFIDMHRHYYTIDGDAQEWKYDLNPNHIYTMTDDHTYTNYVKSSHSIFRYEDISEEEAKELGLYDYPKIVDYDQCPIIGMSVSKAEDDAIRYINGVYGKSHQFRLYVLIYPNKPSSIADKQRSYWEGGNKNELVMCLGYDTSSKKITWAEGFSWCDSPTLEVKSRQWFQAHPNLNLKAYAEFIKPLIKTSWHRKNFDDFSYIDIELSDTQLTFLFIFMLLYNIGISIYVIGNEFTNDEKETRMRSSYRRTFTDNLRLSLNNFKKNFIR